MPIPWGHLIRYAPSILSLTRDVMQRAATPNRPADQETRMAELESNLQRQAEALHALAGQVEGLTKALASLRRALVKAVALAGGALLLAVAALGFVFLR